MTMDVNISKPNIIQYNFDFVGEYIYSQCMWAKINLDYDNFTMEAITDCRRSKNICLNIYEIFTTDFSRGAEPTDIQGD